MSDQVDKPEIKEESPLEKVLKEKRNAMQALNEANERIKQFEDRFKVLEDEKLAKEKNFEELATKRASEVDEWKKRYEESERKIEKGIKASAIKKEFLKLGMNPAYVDDSIKLVDLNSIKFDKENSVVYGADEVAKGIAERFKPLFGHGAPGAGHEAPRGGGEKITLEDWKRLPPEEQKKRRDEIFQNYGINRTR